MYLFSKKEFKMSQIIVLLVVFSIGFSSLFADVTAKDILNKKTQRWDITFDNTNDSSGDSDISIYREVDKVAKEISKISVLLPRIMRIGSCSDSRGCELDSVQCNVITSPVECPNNGELDADLDLCTLPPDIECPSGYESNSDYSLCVRPPDCLNGYVYDSDKKVCVGAIANSTAINTTNSCPDSDMSLNGSKCCKPEEFQTPATVLSCPDGMELKGSTCLGNCYQEPTCDNGGTLSNSGSYVCPNGGTASGTQCIVYAQRFESEQIVGEIYGLYDSSGGVTMCWTNNGESACASGTYEENIFSFNNIDVFGSGYWGNDHSLNGDWSSTSGMTGKFVGTFTNGTFSGKWYSNKWTCPAGFSLNNESCIKSYAASFEYSNTATCNKTCVTNTTTYSCSLGGSLSGNICTITTNATMGLERVGKIYGTYDNANNLTMCWSNNGESACAPGSYGIDTLKFEGSGATGSGTYNSNYEFNGNWSNSAGITGKFYGNFADGNFNGSWYTNVKTCPSGYVLSGNICKFKYYATSETTQDYYSCPYSPTPGSYEKCTSSPKITLVCEEGELANNQCLLPQKCTDIEETKKCSSGTQNTVECIGNFPDTYIKNLYINHLCRCPSQAEYNKWDKFIKEGNTNEELYNFFKSYYESNGEYWNTECLTITDEPLTTQCNGNFPDKDILAIYTDHLCRCPDQEGYDYWLVQKNSGKSNQWIENNIKDVSNVDDDTWHEACNALNNNECYKTILSENQPQCQTDSSFVYNNTINFDIDTEQCESQIVIKCGGSELTEYQYNEDINKCILNPPCPTGNYYNSDYDACIDHATCPLGDSIQCYGPITNSWCSPWACSAANQCGYAYCPSDTTPATSASGYMPTSYTNNYQYDVPGVCSSLNCDLTLNKNLTYCSTKACPRGFGVYENADHCYKDECPDGSSLGQDNKCYSEEDN